LLVRFQVIYTILNYLAYVTISTAFEDNPFLLPFAVATLPNMYVCRLFDKCADAVEALAWLNVCV